MPSAPYELQPIFVLRVAGRPFDYLEKLGLDETLKLARELVAADDGIDAAAKDALAELKAKPDGVSPASRNKLGQALGQRNALPKDDCALPTVQRYRELHAARAELEKRLQTTLEQEFRSARKELLSTVPELVKPFTVFSSSAEMNERLEQALDKGVDGPLDSAARKRERSLLMYLQRVCAKNDTVSEFGPTAWGRVDGAVDGLRFSAQPGVARRDVFLEKWATEGVVAAMNGDPNVRPELCPRVNPNGRVDGTRFILEDSGQAKELSPAEQDLLSACDGATPAWKLGSTELLATLADAQVIIWKAEPVALDPKRFVRLAEEVRSFRDGPAKEKWLPVVEKLLATAEQFKAAKSSEERWRHMQAAREQLASLGAERKDSREVYSANNPIGENCVRDVDFTLGKAQAEVLMRDAAPWLDLWCDTFAYVATQYADKLAPLFRTAPRVNGRVLVPAFIQHCAAHGISLEPNAYGSQVQSAFDDVRKVMREELAPRPDAEEWELTVEECHAVRRRLKFAPFRELVYPSADIMIAASSAEAVARGDYEWILSEFHPGGAVLGNLASWGCPDYQAFGDAYRKNTDRTPFFWGIPGGDGTCHMAMRTYEVVPDLWSFVSPRKPRKDYRVIAPARAEVVFDEEGHDLRVRSLDDGRDLGSLVRHWKVAMNVLHPFDFMLRPHMPRLRRGKVVLQRQFWTLQLSELQGGPFTGLSGRLVAALERLRANRRIPRFGYFRPSAKALMRAGDGGRDKDVKPVFVDFESYHSIDGFHHALSKYGEVEVSEMQPAPHQMLWREPAGRFTYEMRTLVGPADSR